jgi:hypothetical protein
MLIERKIVVATFGAPWPKFSKHDLSGRKKGEEAGAHK